ncbi:TonB-dependent hemoglobin/transferrin/lactoferrin family receptor [Sphingomonas sp. CL5.1]|uniref:TonB-dependent hemoglobin/transferrin/lactoferrin family receptor n=1 Tax=Sphingomonas sp. CL5.1 TaxID=2653203 RepID=UPI001582A7D7|nr:TonB-dependent hemoglobin/transferrin/lactoferrin family receptor [Sphingomonas sp. CL5.1]QKS01098.1 TonB-dependent hemoglobin/transferrin/lactoferrin family receptor [Sphingomonas sp. CL5.1]
MIYGSTNNAGAVRMALSGVALLALAVATSAAARPLEDAQPAAAAGDDGQARDPIVVTGTRIPTPASEVPATVTVIDAGQIADQLAGDIKDLVRFEPGVSVRRAPTRFGAALGATGRDANSGFNIRGLEGNRVLIQVDGVRVPDGFEFGAQSAGRGDYVDLGIVKSVEILRGPASALYGSDGLAGAVSFTTSDPADFLKDRDYGGLARAAYDSSDDQFAETGIVAGRSGQWSAMIAYTRRDGHEYKTDGSNDAPNASRTAANPQDTRSNAVLGKIVWAPDNHNRIRLTYDHYDDHVATDVLSGIAVPPSPPAVLPATAVIGLTARDRTSRDRAALDWRWQGDGFIDFAQLTGWYQWAKNRQFSAEDRNTAADRTRINTFDNRVWGVSAELRSAFTAGGMVNTLAYGGDLSVTRQSGMRDGTVPSPPDVFPTRAFPPTDYTLGGVYLADTVELLGGALRLFPAVRFDYYKLTPKPDALTPAMPSARQDGSRVSPKLGALLSIAPGANIFVNYAQGFKAPSPTQVNQFFSNPAYGYTSVPNPDLRPETSETWEAGVRIGSDAIRFAATAFTGSYKGFIDQEVVGGSFTPGDPAVYQFINLNRVRIKGAEGSLTLADTRGFSGRMAISYSEGTVTDPDGVKSPLASIDPLKLVMGVGYDDPGKRFGGQLVMTHSARKEASDAVGVCGGAPCYRPGAFTILDATAYLKLGEMVTVRAGVFNLLDARYAWWSDVRGLAMTAVTPPTSPATYTDPAVAGAYTQPGRNASVSISVRF